MKRAWVLEWEGEKIEKKKKNWKIHVENRAGDRGSGRFKTKAEKGKGQSTKKENKIDKRRDD